MPSMLVPLIRPSAVMFFISILRLICHKALTKCYSNKLPEIKGTDQGSKLIQSARSASPIRPVTRRRSAGNLLVFKDLQHWHGSNW